MDIGYFTWVTGIASIISLGIQLFDLFPKFRAARGYVLVAAAGLFFGSLINAFETAHISFALEISPTTTIVALFITVILAFLISGAFANDARRRGEFYGIAGIGFMVFMMFVLPFAAVSGNADRIGESHYRPTISELSLLAEQAATRGDIERALQHLEALEARLEARDPRREDLKKRIEDLKRQQLNPARGR